MMIFKYCNLLIPLFLLISGCDSGFEHDIVIRNGTIVDGTGHSRIQGDIALNGNLITVIGLVNGAGKKEIDAKGKIVAPGFIDTHSHHDFGIFEKPDALAAMTNKQSHSDGTLSDAEIKWLTRRAEGGFGIITTAAAHVSIDGQGWDGELGLFDDMHIDKLTTLTDSIHTHGSLSFAQLFHGGMRAPQYLTAITPISASKIPCDESKSGFTRSASGKDIKRIINDFTTAAVRCVQAGFDGIELHGAHGYLISQFLGTKTNMRKDEWGGDLKNRSRLLIEIYRSIKENVPDSFIVGIRISPEISDLGINLDDSINLAGFLRDEGIDYLHISCWDAFAKSKEYPDDSRRLTEWFTQSFNDLPPIISTGSVWSKSDAQELMNQGADLIGVARVAIPYPGWAKKLSQENYNPPRAPFTEQHLREADLSDVFINYMRKWDGFVSNNN